jgi:hypothetical protein
MFGPITYDRMKIDAGFLDRGPLNWRRHDGTTNQRRGHQLTVDSNPNSPLNSAAVAAGALCRRGKRRSQGVVPEQALIRPGGTATVRYRYRASR